MARRRGRAPSQYARRAPAREPYDYILIVCEGGKSEPNYFRRLRKLCNLSNANVLITSADGTDPVSIVKYAQANYDDHDKVYCVFDRDGHANYNDALRMISESDLGRTGKLTAITSVPCFEIWILLHFQYTTAPFNNVGGRSACERVIGEVRKHFADYNKGH